MKRSKLSFIVLVGLLLVSAFRCTAPAATPESAAPTLALEECYLKSPKGNNTIEAECGTLTVAEDPQAPGGRQIELNVVVVPAVSRNPEPDPLVILAGGPGQAATEVFSFMATIFSRIHEQRDILLVDQRGTGESNPLTCDLPDDLSEVDVTDDEIIAALQNCPATLDADPRLYTTEIAMADLDAVREALGYERLNLYGASYGTRAALTYLRLYPDHVRTMVLDGVVSPGYVLYLNTGRDVDRALELFFARCESDPACSEAFPDLRAEFAALLEQMDEAPISVDYRDPLTGEPEELQLDRETFLALTFALLYTPEVVSLLPLDIHTAYAEGNFAPLLAQGGAMDAGLAMGMFYAVACTEDAPYLEGVEEASQGTIFGDRSYALREVCEGWATGELSADFREPVTSDVPVLLISGEADPVTPPRYAEETAEDLPNSLHIVAPQMGHGVAVRGCMPRVIADFIGEGTVAELDAACVDAIEPPPFFVDFTGPRP